MPQVHRADLGKASSFHSMFEEKMEEMEDVPEGNTKLSYKQIKSVAKYKIDIFLTNIWCCYILSLPTRLKTSTKLEILLEDILSVLRDALS